MTAYLCAAAAAAACAAAPPVPATMRAVRKVGVKGCGAPDFGCVAVVDDQPTPAPGRAEVLIRVAGSGVNPDELTTLRAPGVHFTLGIDVAGTVVAIGEGCSGRIKVGDRVWTGAPAGILQLGGMGEYTTRAEKMLGVVPDGVDLAAAGTLPTVAMTSLGALRAAGAPWAGGNVTVLVTAGAGGTGYTAVQLARALGAATIVTAATGDGVAFVKSLGADVVVDFMHASVFDSVPDGSVDVVLSNHKSNTSAAAAMPKLRKPGGVYVTIDTDTLPNSSLPAGVRQVSYDDFAPTEVAKVPEYLDTIGGLLAAGKMRVAVQQTFDFDHAVGALSLEARGRVTSKVGVVPVLPRRAGAA